MNDTPRLVLFGSLLAALAPTGCNHPGTDAARAPASPVTAESELIRETAVASVTAEATPTREARSYPLRRVRHRADLVDVYADPAGVFVASVDDQGSARLWRVGDEADTTPLELPVQDPAWLSLGAVDDTTALVAAIDTTGGAVVWRVGLGPDALAAEVAFEIPPTDPLFEIHVLDGGQRILALGIDHRIRLYDAKGKVVGGLAEPGFIPWQLRVRHSPGRAPELAAVLAHPVRIEALSRSGDELSRNGTAHRVVLDQSPNRNDLALTPDGRTAVSLKRPRSRGRTWAVELIDLETGSRRILAGKNRGRLRPRMHVLDDDRLMLEDGEARGTFYSLADARSLEMLISDLDLEALEVATQTGRRSLEHSVFDSRMRSVVVGRTRIGVGGSHLVIDDLDDESHTRLDAAPLATSAVALSPDSSSLARISGNDVVIQRVEEGAPTSVLGSFEDATHLHWPSPKRLVVITKHGRVRLLDTADGSEVATRTVEQAWGVESTQLLAGSSAGEATVVLHPVKKGAPARAVRIGEATLEAVQPPSGDPAFLPARSEPASRWLEELGHTTDAAGDLRWLRSGGSPQIGITKGQTPRVWIAGDRAAPRSLRLHPGKVARARLSADGRWLAVLNVGFGWSPAPGKTSVTVIDVESAHRVFARSVAPGASFAFSADSHGIVIGDETGTAVFDAATGDLALEL